MALNSNFRTLTADNIEGLVDNRNYLKSSFENGTIQGWTEMAVTLTSGLPTGTPTISSTAAASIALSATSITPLSGSRSLLVTGAAGWTAGQGFISDEFTLDRMDLGKPLTVTFDYERVTGTLNFSGTLGSQTLMVYIYDATAGGANWIQPAGFLGMNQSSGPGRVTATFQTSVVAGQKYRIAVIASQAVGSACSLEFDNFTCSRVTAPIGPVVTDWVSYTPTGSWANTTYAGIWRRVGDTMQGRVRLQCSAIPTNTQLTVNLPAGYTVDLSKYPSSQPATVGLAYVEDFALTGYDGFTFVFNATSIGVKVEDSAAGYARSANITGNAIPFAWNNQDYIVLDFSVIIAGWSSSVQMSNDTDTRVVAASIYGVGATVPVGIVNFQTITADTHGAYSAGVYRFPVSGLYRISVNGFKTSGVTSDCYLRINGVDVSLMTTASTGGTQGSGTLVTKQNAGDTVAIYNNTATWTPASNNWPWLSIERLSGPSVVAASETVAEIRENRAGSVIGTSTTKISYPTVIKSTHSAWDSVNNRFVAPVSGTYSVSVIAQGTSAGSERPFEIYATVNGSASWSLSTVKREPNVASTFGAYGDRYTNNMSGLIPMNAGDYLEVFAISPNGNLGLYPLAGTNKISIIRGGN
jgi:hypothetical protein